VKTILSAIAAGALLSVAAFAAPANAQGYYGDNYRHNYGYNVTRCDRDGDRCATFRCDRDGDDCRRVSGWYARSYNRYSYNNRYDRDRYGRTERRCDRDGDDCHYYRCDRDGDDCRRM
jgi:hypothetical protein